MTPERRPASSDVVIEVKGLRKSYGAVEAVRGIDLEVSRGEIFAFLGPNGAGKTTTVEILEGYREPSGGEIRVLSVNPTRAGRDWRERIGVVLQQCRMPPELTVRETLEQYAGYYRSPRPVEETIGHVGLGEKADARVGRLSGGQQRRLDVAVALIGDPELLFLDEPTTGFDPTARRQAWEVIENLSELGKTIFLTTHYMDEAQSLAGRAAIIAHGRIVAEGRPDELGAAEDSSTRISFRLPRDTSLEELPPAAAGARRQNGTVVIETDRPVPLLGELTAWAMKRDLDLPGLEVRRPSLEDVYLELTAQ